MPDTEVPGQGTAPHKAQYRDGLTGRRLFVWAYRAATVALALTLLASAAVAAFFGFGGPRRDDAVPAVILSLGGAYGFFLNRAVGRNWRAYEGVRGGSASRAVGTLSRGPVPTTVGVLQAIDVRICRRG